MPNAKHAKGGGHPGPRPRTFLAWMKNARPEKVLLLLADGEEETLVVLNRDGRPRYADTISTIETLGAVQVKALNKSGETTGVWELPRPAIAPPPPPGHEPDAADSETVRELKTFAHLLADAHRESKEALVRVVDLQTRHFAEERRAFSSTLLTMDRAMARMQRLSARVRPGDDEDDEPGDGEGDSFMSSLIAPMIQRAVSKEMGAAAPAAEANGKAKP